MPRLAIKSTDDLAQYTDLFGALEEAFGFPPNDFALLAYKPAIMKAAFDLTAAVVFAEGLTSLALRLLVMYKTSRAAGCMYCSAHLATLLERNGVSMEQIQYINDYSTASVFSESERAALAIADRANMVPNAVSDADFELLHRHFNDEAIAEIVAAIGLMSFFNRWNDTLATSLEKPSAQIAARSIAGFTVGKHA